MEKIITIESLIEELFKRKENNANVLQIMSRTTIPREEFERYYHWNDEHYTRNVLARGDDFEALLICWEQGQHSPIHDFNSQEAWIHPVEGKIREERFKIDSKENSCLERVSMVVLGSDEYTYMNQVGIHRYSNAYKGRSVTLNIYCDPVTQWKEYSEDSSEIAVKTPSEDRNYDLLKENA